MPSTTAIFLTYSHRAHFDEKDYEGFLRQHDNPFFNGIAGIARYENWKLVAPYSAALGFDYYDLIYLDGSRTLEEVWFDADLTVFRRGWVDLWGYSSFPPPVVNGQGYVLSGVETPPLAEDGKATLTFLDQGAGLRQPGQWDIEAVMPKHYAYPQGQAPQPWRTERFDRSVLPGDRLTLAEGSPGIALASRRIAP
ncbi:MAG: hypothetical protein WBF87_15485 [Mesorhizobium sp.]